MSESSTRAIDRVQLRALLRAYWQMSARGVSLLRNQEGVPTSLTYVLGIYLVFGGVLSLTALSHIDAFSYALMFDCFTFFVVGMAALVESNDVLFDPREEEILLYRPILPGTLLAAKACALIGFTWMLAGALNFFPTFVGLASHGARFWLPVVHVGSTALLAVFTCSAIVCAYGVVLRWFGRERLDNIAVYAQIVMLILFFGIQSLPGFMREHAAGESSKALLLLPPAWFAAIDATLAGDATAVEMRIAACAAVVSTVVLAWFAVGKLAAPFSEVASRSGLVGAAEEMSSADRAGSASLRTRSWNPITRLWVRGPIEQAAFGLATAYIRRDREIKLRLYPQFGMFVMFMVFALTDWKRERSHNALFVVMMAPVIPVMVVETLRMSSQHAASDLFRYSPLTSASSLFHGVRKAAILLVQLPIVALAIALIAFKPGADAEALEMALAVVLAMPTLSLLPGAFGSFLPLSQPPRRGEISSRNTGVTVAMTIIGCVPIGLAWGSIKLGVYWPMVAVEVVALAFVHRWLLRIVRERPMRAID
jgi:hypothetical protein